MKELTKEERKELKQITQRIRTNRATRREVLRAISLTNRDHAMNQIMGRTQGPIDAK